MNISKDNYFLIYRVHGIPAIFSRLMWREALKISLRTTAAPIARHSFSLFVQWSTILQNIAQIFTVCYCAGAALHYNLIFVFSQTFSKDFTLSCTIPYYFAQLWTVVGRLQPSIEGREKPLHCHALQSTAVHFSCIALCCGFRCSWRKLSLNNSVAAEHLW